MNESIEEKNTKRTIMNEQNIQAKDKDKPTSSIITEVESYHNLFDQETENFIQQLPKVELHVHLDGAFDPAILLNHLKSSESRYASLPAEAFCPWDQSTIPVRALVEECRDLEAFHSICTCRGKRSLHEMLNCFEIFVPIVRGNLEFLEELACDFVKRQAQQNVLYTEVRYSPHLLAKGGTLSGKDAVDAEPVITAITSGLRKGEKEFGVKVNQILCCIAWRPDWAADVVKIAHERRDDFPCAVVGIDIAAGEEHFDKDRYAHLHEPHLRAFKHANKLNLNVTMHAGEVGNSSNIKDAVQNYGATRIGHGYRIIVDPDLMKEMRKKNIHFEICPTSSLETGAWKFDDATDEDWRNHPVVSMIDYGMKVGFNSDDPAVFNTSLTWQLRIAVGKIGIDTKRILETVHDSINAAFLSEDEKIHLRNALGEFSEGNCDTLLKLQDNFAERII